MRSEATAHLADHFGDLVQQRHAARLGMWVFLATEVLLFTGLFVLYADYRYAHPAVFAAGSKHLSLVLGTANTAVLITSSFTVAAARDRAQRRPPGPAPHAHPHTRARAGALHGLHVIIGMTVLAWMLGKVLLGDVARGHPLPLELAALYWHLVDLVWIFLYPLFYLVT
jgi:cytochrome c oxidase subunit 3